MNFEYILALILLLTAYVLGIIFMDKYAANARAASIIFPMAVFVPYVMLCVKIFRDVGWQDWNFQNTLPVANVSPFTFSIMPLLLILPKKLKKHVYLLISLLSVGMLLSGVFSCTYNAAINYKFNFHFLLDYVAHFILSLYGVYLIRSKEAELTLKSSLISGSIIFGVAAVMVILNLIFDTSFFGLSLRGKHNIYNQVLTKSSYQSAALYFLGLGAVLVMGFAYSKLFDKQKFRITNNK